ncbi:MAG: 4-hydroxy-3-methylbut-2-enyl diphosphate reductase, partial [bacterium]
LEHLKNRDITLIDTTCPEVRTVEEKVKEFNQKGFTALIHGKYSHQESIATSSYADKYLIIRDLAEAEYVTNYMLNGGDKSDFLDKFNRASSSDFEPGSDLEKIGVANQTTMLMNESVKIFNKFRETIRKRDGSTENFSSIGTICSATQDRQDAVKNLLKENHFDLFIVVGGHNSSNTQNLARTAAENSSTNVYHIEDSQCFTEKTITYLPVDSKNTLQQQNWLPEGEITVGITAGASTPHSQLESVLEKLLGFY